MLKEEGWSREEFKKKDRRSYGVCWWKREWVMQDREEKFLE